LRALAFLSHDLSVTAIGSQIDTESDQLFTNDRLWTVDDQLEAERDAFGVGESCLQLVFLTQMIQYFQNECTEAGSFEDLNQLGNHSTVVHVHLKLWVKRQVKEEPQGNLEEELIVAGNESLHFFNYTALLHFLFVVAKNA